MTYLEKVAIILDQAVASIGTGAQTIHKKAALKNRVTLLMEIADMVDQGRFYNRMKPVFHAIYDQADNDPIVSRSDAVAEGYILAGDIVGDTDAVRVETFQATLLAVVNQVLIDAQYTPASWAVYQPMVDALLQLARTYAALNPAKAPDTATTTTPDFLDSLWRAQKTADPYTPLSSTTIRAELQTAIAALTELLEGVDNPLQAIQFVNNLVQAATNVESLSAEGVLDAQFFRKLVAFGFEYAKLNSIENSSAVNDGTEAFLATLQKAEIVTDTVKKQATGKFSDLFKKLDTKQKRVQMLEFGGKLFQAVKQLPQEMQQEKQDSKLISALVDLGGAYAASNPSGTPIEGQRDLFLNTLWHATNREEIFEGGKEFSDFFKAFESNQRFEMLKFESSVLKSIEQVLKGRDVVLPVAPDGLRVDDELLVTQIGSGPWEPPGDQPIHFYLGDQAHRGIAAYYVAAHLADNVFTTILSHFQQLGQNVNTAALTNSELGQKPDILNPILRHVYEIKLVSQEENAIPQAKRYQQIFQKAGITIRLGPSIEPGTSGVIQAPGGYYIFASPENGAIIYRYYRGTYDTNFVEQIDESLGLSGLAALLYLIFSEAGRLLIPQPEVP